jgi:hypothetical protein
MLPIPKLGTKNQKKKKKGSKISARTDTHVKYIEREREREREREKWEQTQLVVGLVIAIHGIRSSNCGVQKKPSL